MVSKSPTIYDVAEAAQVSAATVSNTLNRPDRVGAATRARVVEVMDRLGYAPKAEAVQLARRGMRRIAVLAPFTSYPSFYERLNGVLREAKREHIEVSVFDFESAATASSPVLNSLPIQGQVDGVIVMGEAIEDRIEEQLAKRAMPTVVIDATSRLFPTVGSDDAVGGAVAADHLLGLGHRRIAYLIERQVADYDSQAVARFRGFRQACEAAGEVELVPFHAAAGVDDAAEEIRSVLQGESPVTAIMAHYDDMAISVMREAQALGIRVPDDLSIMGYDDGPSARAMGLTTVRQPFEESGAVGARLLFGLMKGGGPRSHTDLAVELVTRESTGTVLVNCFT